MQGNYEKYNEVHSELLWYYLKDDWEIKDDKGNLQVHNKISDSTNIFNKITNT